MLTRDPKTGKVMRDSYSETADELFGLGRQKKSRAERVAERVARRAQHQARRLERRAMRDQRRASRGIVASAPAPSYAPPVEDRAPYYAPPVEERPAYSAPPVDERETYAYPPVEDRTPPASIPIPQDATPDYVLPEEMNAAPSEDYGGGYDEAVQAEGCCGGYLITHATEPNIYPYEAPKTWVSALRKKPLGRGAYFEDIPPRHPPTWAERLRTRKKLPGMGHHRNGGYLPFESGPSRVSGIFGGGMTAGITQAMAGGALIAFSDFFPDKFQTLAKIGGGLLIVDGVFGLFAGGGKEEPATVTPITREEVVRVIGSIVKPANNGKADRGFLKGSYPMTVRIINQSGMAQKIQAVITVDEHAGILSKSKQTSTSSHIVSLPADESPVVLDFNQPISHTFFPEGIDAVATLKVAGRVISTSMFKIG